jgi:hypothetical protein
MTAPLFAAEPTHAWVWESMAGIALVLVLLNVLLIVLVHGRRIRQYLRRARERRFQEKRDEVMVRHGYPPEGWWDFTGFG